MKEVPFSLLDSGDNFLDNTDVLIEGNTTFSNVQVNPEPVYEIGYADVSAVLPEHEYNLMSSMSWTLIIGIIAVVVILIIWYFISRFTQDTTLPQKNDTDATKINVFMQNVNSGGYVTSGSASGVRYSEDCENNNCVAQTINGVPVFNCFTNDNGIIEWEGNQCQLPIITPYYTSIIRMTAAEVIALDFAEAIVDVGYESPSQVAGQLGVGPGNSGALYDLTDPSPTTPGAYRTYLIAGRINVTNSLLVRNSILFGQVTKSLMLFVVDLQLLDFGTSVVRINFDQLPQLTFLINPNNVNVTSLSPDPTQQQTVTFSKAYSLYNPEQIQISIASPSVNVTTESNFIPYTNLNLETTTITSLN